MIENLIWLGILLIVIGIVAFVLGARGIAGMTAGLGKTLLVVGLVLGAILIVLNFLAGG
ncbi:MAG: DUF1328 family protein [Planctomycetota bacterium]